MLRTLVYLRHNVAHEVVGHLFGVSADTSENTFHEVVAVLRDVCPSERIDPGHRGPMADKRVYAQSGVGEPFPEVARQGDLGYQGVPEMRAPCKKPKGG